MADISNIYNRHVYQQNRKKCKNYNNGYFLIKPRMLLLALVIVAVGQVKRGPLYLIRNLLRCSDICLDYYLYYIIKLSCIIKLRSRRGLVGSVLAY